MGCGSSAMAPQGMTGAVPPGLPPKNENVGKGDPSESNTAQNSMISPEPGNPQPPVGNNALALPLNNTIPKESKLKKAEDIEALTYLQKVEKQCVVELNVSRWKGSRAKGQPMDIPALSKQLGKATALQTLYLGKNDLDDELVATLCTGLQTNKSVTKLGLDWNEITAEGASSLSTVVQSNQTLTYLDLSNNQLGDAGAKVLGQLLASPSCALQVLNINANSIGSEGAQCLADGLKANATVESVAISRNKMGAGNNHFAEMFKTNFTLSSFLLMQTGASLETSIQIKRALRRNAAMKELRDHKVAFLMGCRPTVAKQANTSELYSVLVQGHGFERSLLQEIWTFMHN